MVNHVVAGILEPTKVGSLFSHHRAAMIGLVSSSCIAFIFFLLMMHFNFPRHSTTGQSRVGHRDSHQGPPPSSFTFVVARHLPFPRPYPTAPPQAPAPPYAAIPHQAAPAPRNALFELFVLFIYLFEFRVCSSRI